MIDVIVPTHDGWKHLDLCIQAVERFTKNDFKLIIVNNGSQLKETRKVLDKAKSSGHVVVELAQNVSFSKAINAGLAVSKGEYVTLLNDDVYVLESWDAQMVSELADRTVGMVGAMMPGASAGFQNDPSFAKVLKIPFLVFAHVMTRRDVIDKVGMLDAETFDGYGSEDIDYSFRVKEAGYKLEVSSVRSLHVGGASMNRLMDRGSEYSRMHRKLLAKWGDEYVAKNMKMFPRVALVVPTYNGKVDNDFLQSCLSLDKTGPFQLEVFQSKRLVIHYARELLAEMVLDQGFDYIWWLDDDMVFPGDTLTRLMKHQKKMVCAIAYQRKEPYNACIFEKKNGRYEHMNNAEHTGLREIAGCGSACTLMETSILKQTKGKRPWFDNKKFGEDLHFCNLMNEEKIPIYCDTDLIIGHIGDPVIVNEALVAKYKQAKAEQMSQRVLV